MMFTIVKIELIDVSIQSILAQHYYNYTKLKPTSPRIKRVILIT